MRAPELYEVPEAPTVTPEEFFAQDDRLPGESDRDFVYRMQELVAKQIAHYWPSWDSDALKTFRIRIPPWENFILYVRSFSKPYAYARYEYCNYKKAVQRGVGLCSQKAIIFSAIMNRNGMESRPMGLSGHVIATVRSANLEPEEWIVDADFGFVAEHTLNEVAANTEMVRPYYEATNLRPFRVNDFVRYYDNEGNAPYEAYEHNCPIEAKAYRDKWLIPILLMLPYLAIVTVRYLRRRDVRHLNE